MKKLITLTLLSIFFITFQSCSDDSSNKTPIDKNLLLGEWVLKDVYSKNGKIEYTTQGKTISGKIIIKGKNFTNTQEFTEAPNKFNSKGGLTLITTVSVPGQNETNEQETPNQTITGNWSINDNKLTTTSNQHNGLSSTVTITDLTESSLVINQNLSDSEQFTGLEGIKIKGSLVFIYDRK